ncbi:MAG: AbrB/MazE/SpoVT family DNA-binding domain-containing protein [Candidatus Woesearchaeota archaeon]
MIESIRTAIISSKRQITIPIECNNFKAGNKALIITHKDGIIIKPMPKNILETALLSEKLLSECWNSKEDEKAFAYLQHAKI